jgi:hypothetical protein
MVIRIGLAFRVNCREFYNITFLEITGYWIKYSTLLWLIELQIRRGRKVETQLYAVNSNSRASNCQFSLFSKKNPVIRMFCIAGWLAVPVIPDKWSSTEFLKWGFDFSGLVKVMCSVLRSRRKEYQVNSVTRFASLKNDHKLTVPYKKADIQLSAHTSILLILLCRT